jgi:TM2 domain-containing membrane protein YozV
METQIAKFIPEAEYDELLLLDQLMKGKSDEDIKRFVGIYRSRRKEKQTTLILCLVGLFGFAGLHRLVNGDIGMGILYLLTGGLCFIGTIVDLVNHEKLNLGANRKIMREVSMYAYY